LLTLIKRIFLVVDKFIPIFRKLVQDFKNTVTLANSFPIIVEFSSHMIGRCFDDTKIFLLYQMNPVQIECNKSVLPW
jgi:hypothetical protein